MAPTVKHLDGRKIELRQSKDVPGVVEGVGIGRKGIGHFDGGPYGHQNGVVVCTALDESCDFEGGGLVGTQCGQLVVHHLRLTLWGPNKTEGRVRPKDFDVCRLAIVDGGGATSVNAYAWALQTNLHLAVVGRRSNKQNVVGVDVQGVCRQHCVTVGHHPFRNGNVCGCVAGFEGVGKKHAGLKFYPAIQLGKQHVQTLVSRIEERGVKGHHLDSVGGKHTFERRGIDQVQWGGCGKRGVHLTTQIKGVVTSCALAPRHGAHQGPTQSAQNENQWT